jgi:peptidoglycan/xylan/chitin deacetylase (PgdA/CDA1 family)
MYFHKTPDFLKRIYPQLIWNNPPGEQKIYLTFDDGPIPMVTPFVLEQLESRACKATFFCIGDNVAKHRDIFHQVIDSGHSIGNHTFHHLNSWVTPANVYLEDVEKCDEVIKTIANFKPRLFRPPYGRIKRNVIPHLTREYQVIMWDNLTGDFDPKLTKERCLTSAIKNTADGSIVTFHDSLKAQNNLEYTLPALLDHFLKKGFSFCPL